MFNKIQKGIGDALELPPDVVGDGAKITIIGRHQIVVENFISITAFSEEEILLETVEGVLSFQGKGFVLRTILPTELHIEGELFSLSYGERGKGNE